MRLMYPGLKETTAGEYQVLGCFCLVVPVVTGLILLYFGYTATEDKKALASLAVTIGWIIIFSPIGLFIIWLLIRRFFDR